MEIKFKKTKEAITPKYQSKGASGFDLHSTENILIESGKWELISTGLFFEIPQGFEIQIRPRSGLALKYGITVLNSVGTIDSDYRGEIKVILINHSQNNYQIQKGDRIAQAIISSVITISDFIEINELSSTKRGNKGFGSSGK